MKQNSRHQIRNAFGFLAAALLLSTSNSQLSTVFAQGTAFTYQGRLTDNGSPANGNYDLLFTLYDAPGGSNVMGGPLTNTPTAVSNGLFTVTLDFGGGAFPGAGRWLEIDVRTNGGGAFIPLSARQQLTATPYAIIAGDVTGANIARLNVVNTTLQAAGTPVVTSGFITGANLTFGGAGYGTAPLVTVSGISGSGAIIAATVSNGVVTALMIQNAGAGYPSNATLTIAAPPNNANQTFASTNFFTGVNTLSNVNNTFAGNGAGLTGLNASQISSGTIADARLSGNVALRAGGNALTGQQTITGGSVGIGATSPLAALHVKGADGAQFILQNSADNSYWYFSDDVNDNLVFQPDTGVGAYIDRSGNYHINSDERLKRDIAQLEGVLDRVLQLRPVSYHFRTAPRGTPLTFGLIAQEVEPLFPEVVGERAGLKSLAYTELVPVTIRAVQELNQKMDSENAKLRAEKDGQIRDLQTQNEKLEQRLEALEKIIDTLESKK